MGGICNRKYGEIRMNLDNFQIFCDLCKNCFSDLSLFVEHIKMHQQWQAKAVQMVSGERNKLHKFDLMMNTIASDNKLRDMLPFWTLQTQQGSRASFLQQSCIFECLQLRWMASETQGIMSKYMTANESEKPSVLLEMTSISVKIVKECELLWNTKSMPQLLSIENSLANDAIARTAFALSLFNEKLDISPQQSPCTASNSPSSDNLRTLFDQMGTSTMPQMKILDQLCFVQASSELALGDCGSSQLSLLYEVHSTTNHRFASKCALMNDASEFWNDEDGATTIASIEYSRCYMVQDCSDDTLCRGDDGDDELMTTSCACDNEGATATEYGLKIKDSLFMYAKMKIRAASSSDSFICPRRFVGAPISHSSDWLSFEEISPNRKSSASIEAGLKERKLICKLLQLFSDFQPAKTVYTCGQCQKQFDDSRAPIQHESTPPKQSKRRMCVKHACALTSLETVHSFDLKQRQRTDFPHLCGTCGMRFRQRDELSAHINKRHTNLYSHVCKVCRLGFGTGAQLEIHMRRHTGEKPYFCHVCRKPFRTLGAIIAHINCHAKDRVHECNDCGQRFYSRKKLMRHIKTHSIARVYNCNDCGRSFGSRHCQRVHELIHATERRYPCKLCGKTFQCFAARHNHIRLMHKLTPAGNNGTRSLDLGKWLYL